MDAAHMIFFYFLIYSFLGWVVEGLFNLYKHGRFSKPNFLYLPLKPMYGIATVLLIRLQVLIPLWLFLICCFIVPAMIEYLTAFLLLYSFNLRYWDYQHMPYQLSGFICLRFCLYWFYLSLILIYAVQPFISSLYWRMTTLWFYFFPIFLLLFITDFIVTIRNKRCRFNHSKN